MANHMMDDLNRKFSTYGIVFEQCSVTNVIVNPQLLSALQEKTKLKFDLKNHEKDQENKKLTLENEEQQKLTDLQRYNERKMFELKQNIQRANVDKEQDEMQANTLKDVGRVKAEEDASVLLTQSQGQQKIVVNEVKAQTVTMINNAKAEANKLVINTDQQIAVMKIEAETENSKAKSKYVALTQECNAERSNLQAMEAQRMHSYEMAKAEAYESLNGGHNPQSKIVMSGQSGEDFLTKMFQLDL